MKTTNPLLELNRQELEKILERALTVPLAEDNYQKLHAVLDALAYMTQLLENKNTSIERLRQIVFGASTEKTGQILEKMTGQAGTSPTSPSSEEQSNDVPSPQPPCSPPADTEPSPGHGRNGAQAYAGAEKVKVGHVMYESALCQVRIVGPVFELRASVGQTATQAWQSEQLRRDRFF